MEETREESMVDRSSDHPPKKDSGRKKKEDKKKGIDASVTINEVIKSKLVN